MNFSNEACGDTKLACRQDNGTKHIVVNKSNFFLVRGSWPFRRALSSAAYFLLSRTRAEGFLSCAERQTVILSMLLISGIKSVLVVGTDGVVALRTSMTTCGSIVGVFSSFLSEKKQFDFVVLPEVV